MKPELYQFEYQPGVRFAFSAPEHFQGTTLHRIVDTVTGVLYLQATTEQGVSITPLVDGDGDPVIQDIFLRVEMETLSSMKEVSKILKSLTERTYEYRDEDGEEENEEISARECTSSSLLEHMKSHPGGYFDAILSSDYDYGRSVRIYPWDPNTRQGGYLEVEVQEDGGLDDVLALPICAGGKPLGVVCED